MGRNSYVSKYAVYDLLPKVREDMLIELKSTLSSADALNFFLLETMKCLPVFSKRLVRTSMNHFIVSYGGAFFRLTLSRPLNREGVVKGKLTETHYEPYLQALRKRWNVSFEKSVNSYEMEFRATTTINPFGENKDISIVLCVADVQSCKVVEVVKERVVRDVQYLVDCAEEQ